MFKKVIIVLSFFLLAFPAFPILPQLSEESKVVMFTAGPGLELYAGFGHSALWISDPVNKVDRLYNYGTFDFDTPNFYGKFVRGKLDYILSVYPFRYFIEDNSSSKRLVTGQLLNLNLAEKQRMFEYLENNALPEHCFYKYDFLWDNCSTRIRDVLTKTIDGKLDFNTRDVNISFRKMLYPYLTYTPWTKFGINMILGLPSDRKATPWEYMYLPESMRIAFAGATIESNGVKRKLVTEERQYLPCRLTFTNNKFDDPIPVFSMILLVIVLITLYEWKKNMRFKWMDYILFTISSIAGLFLFFMWVGTDHAATAKNMNVLWLFPAQALFLVSFFFRNELRRKMILTAFIYQFLVSFIMFIWPQDAEISFMIISFVFVVRIGSSFIRIQHQKAISYFH